MIFFKKMVCYASFMLTPLAQVLYPPACLLCSSRLADASSSLCRACERDCPALLPPVCRRCGVPLRGAHDLSTDCRRCLSEPPIFDRARAPFLYDDRMRDAVQAFKYRGHHRLGAWMAEAMARTAASSLPVTEIDGIVATPLHWLKRRVKGWNPAEALAEQVARALAVPCWTGALRRVRWTTTQTRLAPAARHRNVRTAFRAKARPGDGRSVLLVDDVLTTGATANACATALKAAGISSIFVLTAARPAP